MSPILRLQPHLLRVLCRHKSTVPRVVPLPKLVRHPVEKDDPLTTHYKITLKRSTIGLPKAVGATARSLGFFRRFQTVYHRHSAPIAGKILALKELVSVENVPRSAVQTRRQINAARKATRGYKVIKSDGYGKGLAI